MGGTTSDGPHHHMHTPPKLRGLSGSGSSNMDAPIGVGGTASGSSPQHMQTPPKSRIPNRFFCVVISRQNRQGSRTTFEI